MAVHCMALNGDTSWALSIDGSPDHTVWLDPWLSASQVDGAAWFSRQSHVDRYLSVGEALSVAPPAAVVVSLPFTDHCDRDTIVELPDAVSWAASPPAVRKVAQWVDRSVQILGPTDQQLTREVRAQWLAPRGLLDLVHAAVWLELGGCSVLYAPHGLPADHPGLAGRQAEVLITTTSRYDLPWFVGGTVNLGLDAALALAQAVGATTLVPCHNEAKRAAGLVSRLARRTVAGPTQVQAAFKGRVVRPALGGWTPLVGG